MTSATASATTRVRAVAAPSAAANHRRAPDLRSPGTCSCISGIPAIHIPELAPAFPGYRPSISRNLLLHFRDTGHPWPFTGNCSCISGIPAIHGHKKNGGDFSPPFLLLLRFDLWVRATVCAPGAPDQSRSSALRSLARRFCSLAR
jgi:hypothetical protein